MIQHGNRISGIWEDEEYHATRLPRVRVLSNRTKYLFKFRWLVLAFVAGAMVGHFFS